mgnify:CR=1 FL=1
MCRPSAWEGPNAREYPKVKGRPNRFVFHQNRRPANGAPPTHTPMADLHPLWGLLEERPAKKSVGTITNDSARPVHGRAQIAAPIAPPSAIPQVQLPSLARSAVQNTSATAAAAVEWLR